MSARPDSVSDRRGQFAALAAQQADGSAEHPDRMELATLLTVRDLLRYATSRFEAATLSYGHGTDNAYDEAVWAVLWSLHLPPDRLDVFLDARVLASERATVVGLIGQRCASREPLAYLIGEAWLLGHRFLSDRRALVPRSLIGEALDSSLNDWIDTPPAKILDLCTGGGSIAILAALRWPDAHVIGSDLSADALALAGENIALHRCGEHVELRQGDLFAPLAGERFDLILCNPPYVNAASMAALPAEYQAEPRTALAGGGDGMDLVRRIIAESAAHLTTHGVLVIEIGHEADGFEAAFAELEFAYVPVTAGERQLVLIDRAALHR